MKKLLKRFVILGVLVAGAYLAWNQRDRIALIENNNLRIQGTWYEYTMNRKGFEAYYFAERIITKDGSEWGSYELRSNDEIEVVTGPRLETYLLSFPSDDTMVWSTEIDDGKIVEVRRWQR